MNKFVGSNYVCAFLMHFLLDLVFTSQHYDLLDGQDIHVHDNALTFQFCIDSHSEVFINGICLRSDKSLNNLVVELNNTFQTTLDIRNHGNNDVQCVLRSILVLLHSGENILQISKRDNNVGDYAIDFFTFSTTSVNNADFSTCPFSCERTSKNPNVKGLKEGKSMTGTIKNYSYKTTCAEVDNVNIPIFYPEVQALQITALPPSYNTNNNYRQADFNTCILGKTEILRIQNYQFGNEMLVHNKYTLKEGYDSNRHILLLEFLLDGPQKDASDSELGSSVYLKLSNVTKNIEIIFSYYGRDGRWVITSPVIFFQPRKNPVLHEWRVPDFTWSSIAPNYIRFTLPDDFNDGVYVDTILIVSRPLLPDKAFTMFNDPPLLLEGVDMDFWWLNTNGTMSINVINTNSTFTAADYLRVYVPASPTGSNWCQVFVLYQDGNIRLLHKTPEIFDWIPFGSSILVGETNPEIRRPFAPIRHIDIDVDALRFDISYYDGNFLSLILNTEYQSTSLILTNINLKNQLKLPFVTFRSMYVSDGNSDCDRVKIDDTNDVHILSEWDEITGSTFLFYRKFESVHNTQSPDFLIEPQYSCTVEGSDVANKKCFIQFDFVCMMLSFLVFIFCHL